MVCVPFKIYGFSITIPNEIFIRERSWIWIIYANLRLWNGSIFTTTVLTQHVQLIIYHSLKNCALCLCPLFDIASNAFICFQSKWNNHILFLNNFYNNFYIFNIKINKTNPIAIAFACIWLFSAFVKLQICIYNECGQCHVRSKNV